MKDSRHEKVIHSSLQEVLRLGLDSDFPASCSSIGLIVKRKNFGGVDLSIHTPRLSSLISGEILECEDEDLDIRLRKELLDLAKVCKEIANYLMAEKKRLEDCAKKEILIYESVDTPIDISLESDESSDPSESASKKRARQSAIQSSIDLDLDLDIFS